MDGPTTKKLQITWKTLSFMAKNPDVVHFDYLSAEYQSLCAVQRLVAQVYIAQDILELPDRL